MVLAAATWLRQSVICKAAMCTPMVVMSHLDDILPWYHLCSSWGWLLLAVAHIPMPNDDCVWHVAALTASFCAHVVTASSLVFCM